MTREVNRALLAVRIAAARRRSNDATRLVTERERHGTAGVQTAHAGVQMDTQGAQARRGEHADPAVFPRSA